MGQPSAAADADAAALAGWQADLRGQVVDRLRMFNAHHAEHAWTRRYRDPIAAHAVAFLFAEAAPHRPGWILRTATRLALEGPEVATADAMLYELGQVARRYLATGGFDMRVQMADRCEPMSRHAVYVGLGLSTLDTPDGSWQAVRREASGPLTIRGRGYAVLSDGSAVLVERRRHSDLHSVVIRSSHPCNGPWGQPRNYRWLTGLTDEHTGAGSALVWQRLLGLHELLLEATRGR